jgi:hypothetical protein
MASSVQTHRSTRDKLLRARKAAAQLAQLSTSERNAILLAMANALKLNVASILAATRRIWILPDWPAQCATGSC